VRVGAPGSPSTNREHSGPSAEPRHKRKHGRGWQYPMDLTFGEPSAVRVSCVWVGFARQLQVHSLASEGTEHLCLDGSGGHPGAVRPGADGKADCVAVIRWP
jgi:hypothetical protein